MVQVADVLEARKGVAKFVVLSAMGGATDELLRAGRLAKQGDPAWHTLVADLRTRHLDACDGLIQGDGQQACATKSSMDSATFVPFVRGCSCFMSSARTPATRW